MYTNVWQSVPIICIMQNPTLPFINDLLKIVLLMAWTQGVDSSYHKWIVVNVRRVLFEALAYTVT